MTDKEKFNYLQTHLAKIENRWREASKDKCFRRHYRDIMAECANELHGLLDMVSSELVEKNES